MRTLKKTLCLVLCLVMVAGLCVMGASAIDYKDYADVDKIEHKEAVMLLTALGVLQGDEKGFRPEDTLTRAEAAKIIVALQNVNPTGTSSFSDMEGATWAQPYVAYCELEKIVEGVGDGKFNPSGELKFADFAAMLLRLIGFDKDYENMTGPAYQIAVARLVNQIDLAHDISVYDYNKPLTRDMAAQMAFNALRADSVAYTGRITLDRDGNWALKSEAVVSTAPDYRIPYTADGVLQVCEAFWPLLRLHADANGDPYDLWWLAKTREDRVFANEKVIVRVLVGDILAKYDDPDSVTLSQLYTDALWNSELAKTRSIAVNENGNATGTALRPNSLDKKTTLGYAGATATLIDRGWIDDEGHILERRGYATHLNVSYAYLAQVTAIIPANETKYGLRQVELRVFDPNGPTDIVYTTDDFSRWDYVLVQPYAQLGEPITERTGIMSVKLAESVEGTLTKVSLSRGAVTALTVGGKSYPVADDALAVMGMRLSNGQYLPVAASNSQLALNKTHKLFLANGYVVGVTGEGPDYSRYVFYTQAAPVNNDDVDVTLPITADQDEVELWKIGYVKQDATTDTAKVLEDDLTFRSGWYMLRDTEYGTKKFVAPGVADDAYVLDANTGCQNLAQGLNLRKDIAQYTGIIADNKTVFILYTATKGYQRYIGLSNVPSYTVKSEDGVDLYPLIGGDGIAKAVFVDLSHEEADPTLGNVAYITSNTPTAKWTDEAKNVNLYYFPAVVNGKFTTVTTKNIEVMPKGLIEITRVDDDGYVTDFRKLRSAEEVVSGETLAQEYFTAEAPENVPIVFSNGTLIVNGTAFATTSKTVVFYKQGGKTIEAGDPSELDGLKTSTEKGDTKLVVDVRPVNMKTDKSALEIYVRVEKA